MTRWSGYRADDQWSDWRRCQTQEIVDAAIQAGSSTAPELAAATGMSLRYAYEQLAKRRPRRKLQETIAGLYAAGEAPSAIAAALGCSRQYVHRVIKQAPPTLQM